jgi:asparagine synthase (glutamine-hydrolysing)
VLVGGWGSRALELLESAGARGGEATERVGGLVVAGAEGAGEGRWRCWVSGRLSGAGEPERLAGSVGPASASELAVAAHERAGERAVDLLRGSFLLVSADRERGSASVARDQLGGRPLVYFRLGDGALFAEHEHQLLELLPTLPGPDPLAVAHWVERGGVPPGRTLYQGLLRLPPGHRLALSSAGVAVERYWAPRYQGTVAGSRGEIAERLRVEAFAAVERAAAGPERVAVRLSGGLDSACVAAGLAARGPAAAQALAVAAVFPGQAETDERELIEATATHTGLALERVAFAGPAPILEPAQRHIERWRLPPGSPNLYVWEPVAALARERGVGAMLDGEGGDELFGLAPYLIADALRGGRLGEAWSLSGAIPGIGEDPDPRLRLRALRVFGVGGLLPARARNRRRRRAAARAQGSLLGPPALLVLAGLDEEVAAHRLDGPLWWRSLAADLAGGGEAFDVAGHLRREAVAGGLDGRHPFLFDRDLVATVLANPPRLQFDPVRDRALLRDALRGQIPEQVRTRYAKSHFTPQLTAALAGAEGEALAAALGRPGAPLRAFVRAEPLQRLLARRGPKMPGGVALQLWRLGMVDAWLQSLE